MMSSVYTGKRIVVGVTGSIAAFKVAGWVSTLAKEEAQVSVVMTRSATQFITPLTFSSLSGNKVHVDMFDAEGGETMAHIMLGREADLVIVAPATANTIGNLAGGLAPDLLSTTILATRAPVIVCPAMNSRMYTHPAVQNNLKRLVECNYTVIDPDEGVMACKEDGKGRLPEWDQVDPIFQKSISKQDLKAVKILITAGPTREAIDPARFLSNRSSGKMGYRLAEAAARRGAEVTLVSGPTALAPPVGVRCVKVQSAVDMHAAVMQHAEENKVIIKSAAVADYRSREIAAEKIKKDKISEHLELARNPDILFELGQRKKSGQLLVGFAAESSNLEVEGRKKLEAKNLDLIAVNNINSDDTGFETDNNQVLLLSANDAEMLPFTSKAQTSDLILDRVCRLL
ncbi:bifunctional phosphopantothenoylcysteine decarboxylase/phosphopantothenate--cysteine ligase CoaBC [Desulfopila sp. IMCC35008]|uniref:bifunctional phosphopantothenoylcysteine decarboxylase/phosphopantothenate--cysteine ligase CoaBC n=1 Tax=Desulfopila sp. IMCC35008 TaxID=2653858 RepID=UPI001F117210|nr:bifunctional phosphopantothenoylcysteine decarboxylase/phosphopantothenate--cysteine ligase CoaBC [Desulfopila sp. IMCC35008]